MRLQTPELVHTIPFEPPVNWEVQEGPVTSEVLEALKLGTTHRQRHEENSEVSKISHGEILNELTIRRTLTEIDHLNRLRNPDGSHNQMAVIGVMENLVPAVKEASIPHAVSTTYQPYLNGEFMWMDMTAEEAAASGYIFHEHPAALARVEVEKDEARSYKELQPGMVKVLLSPKMSRTDASYEVAKAEHLADDDMIRIHSLDIDNGTILGKYMQSVLLRDVPLEAWIAMLKDPKNIFGKAVPVADETSALAVMKIHRELQLPLEALPEGVISIAEAVIPYLEPLARRSVYAQLRLLRADQAEIHAQAENIAARWVDFELALADSVRDGFVTAPVMQFLASVIAELPDHTKELLSRHTTADGRLQIDAKREVAAVLERLRRNTLWTSAAVISGNQDVLDQLTPELRQCIHSNEMLLQQTMQAGALASEVNAIEAQNNQQIAAANVSVGKGCPGLLERLFGGSAETSSPNENEANTKADEDQYGSLTFKCPKGHFNWRSRNQLIEKCRICDVSVKC